MNKSTDNDLTNLLGMTVTVETNSNTTLTGNIFSFHREDKGKTLLFLASSSSKSSFYIINLSQIRKISESHEKLEYSDLYNDLLKPNISLVLEKERMNVEKNNLKVRSDKSNLLYKTYLKGYTIYDRLSRLYSLRYTGQKILFEELDAYIDLPFNIKDIHCEDESTLVFLQKQIEQCLDGI